MPWNQQPDNLDEDQVIDLDGDGQIKNTTPARQKKYPNAPAVRKLFQQILGLNPSNWKVNKTQLQACENLYTERGLEKIENALEFYKEHRSEKFCPNVSSPYDLDSKYAKLSQFKTKDEH